MSSRCHRAFAVSALLVACACRAPAPDASPEPEAGPPNIVVILADDLGYGDPSCNAADSRIATPRIDALARDGMRFTDAHAPGSVCVPSRYGLLCGRYPCRRGPLRPRREAVIEADRETIASVLRRRGYATAMVGKWHLGFDGGPADRDWAQPLTGGPVDRGFDTYLGIPASLDIPPYYYIRDRKPLAPPTDRVEASHTAGWTDIQGAFWRAGDVAPGFEFEDVLPRFGREAVAYVESRADADDGKPFFLYVALTAPHTPWLPLPGFRGRSGAGLYGDFVMQVDHTVGEILRALDRRGLRERTLVVFSSDNGPVWYPADVERLGHRSVGPLRGMKGDAWEGGHRMPFVARWPGRVPAGAVSDQTICFTDLLATFAELAHAEVPDGAGADSVSFAKVLLGDATTSARDVTILKANASVVRQGKWKLITHLGSGGFSKPRRQEAEPDGPQGQLYDLDADPGETTNLWLERSDVVARLEAARAAAVADDGS